MLRTVLLWGLILLSIATGVTKLAQLPQEMALFQGAGWSVPLILIFGAIQTTGGVLIAIAATRRIG